MAEGLLMNLFFFSSRRRHTRCSRDWSSDVCSSDLGSSRSDSFVMWSCSLKNLDEMHPLDGNSTFLKSYHYLTNVPLNIRQELALSRTAGTHRRRIHAAPVHDFLLPGSAEASRLPPSLYSTDSEDAESGQ